MGVPRVGEESITSPIFRVRGQRSRWRYLDDRITPEHCEVLRNVNISERGTAESRFGTTTYNPTQLAGGEVAVGLWQGTFANGNTKQVVVTPTKVYDVTASTKSAITGTALTGGNDDRVRFEFLKDQLIFSNGVDTPRVWAGSSNTSNLATVPWSKITDFMVHKNLMIAMGPTEGGTKYPTRIRWCDIDRVNFVVNLNTWRDTNRYEIYDGGPAIVGGVDNWGQALIFKEDGLYPGEIFYDQLGHFDFRLGQPRRGFSPVSKMSIVARPEFVFGAAKEGIFVIRPDLSFDIVNTDDTDHWFALNRGRLSLCQAFVRERDHQVRLIVSSEGNTTGHNHELVWDWETGDIWVDLPSVKKSYAETVDISGSEFDWFGGTDGYLYQGNNSSYQDDNGIGFTWRIKMHPNDLGLPGKKKHILNLRTYHRFREGSSTITVRCNVDQGRSELRSGAVTVGSGIEWDDTNNEWDTGLIWPGAEALIADFEVNRIAEVVAPEWEASNPAGIEGYQVEFIPLEN